LAPKHRKSEVRLLSKDEKQPAVYPDNDDGMLGFPKPSWGDWETRDVYVVDFRQTPEFAAGDE
jgi:hypothetical protein